MKGNGIKIWIVASFALIILSYGLSAYDVSVAGWMRIGGFLSSMLAVGYYVCSPATMPGKVSYAGVVFMAIGIVFKILHWTGANETIIAGLLIFGIPSAIEFFKRSRQQEQ
jgi:hypothetical protein